MELFFIILLVLSSIIGLTIIVERGLALRFKKILPEPVTRAVENSQADQDLSRLRQVCVDHSSPLSRLLMVAIEHRDWSKNDNAELLQTRARHEIVQLERGLVILEIIVGIAPLLGLVGTIYGLILLFGTLGPQGAGDNAKMASGIAVALNATLLGLITAIPSLIAWSYYQRKVETLTVELERVCDEFLRKIYRNSPPATENKRVATAKVSA
jgi:biopolymer transport protein ExbB